MSTSQESSRSLRIFDLDETSFRKTLLSAGYTLRFDESREESLTVLDDYGWRIWRSDHLLLRRSEEQLQLYHHEGLIATTPAKTDWRFSWQLPDGELAHQLKQLIDLRAFVPKYSCQLQTRTGAILNDDEKGVARLNVYALIGGEEVPQNLLEVISLRGYQDDFRQIIRLSEPLSGKQMHGFNLRELLTRSGMQIEHNPPKPIFHLNSQEQAEPAVLRMALTLLEAARHHEGGILEDIDTEFVHQYRVSLRKARSLVSLFRKCLSTERFTLIKSNLKAIASATSTLRDLDVFLLHSVCYRSLLPEDYWPGLKQIVSRIKRRRKRAQERIVAHLRSDDYQSQLEDLINTLQSPPDLSTRQSGMPVVQQVEKNMLKQYRHIRRIGLTCMSDPSDDMLHRLRIECKKLRYLLELFNELFSKDALRPLVRSLKRLQNTLGAFNDYSVQGQFLREYGQRMKRSVEQQASLHGLVAALHSRQIRERSTIQKHITAFTAKSIENQVHALFATHPGEDS